MSSTSPLNSSILSEQQEGVAAATTPSKPQSQEQQLAEPGTTDNNPSDQEDEEDRSPLVQMTPALDIDQPSFQSKSDPVDDARALYPSRTLELQAEDIPIPISPTSIYEDLQASRVSIAHRVPPTSTTSNKPASQTNPDPAPRSQTKSIISQRGGATLNSTNPSSQLSAGGSTPPDQLCQAQLEEDLPLNSSTQLKTSSMVPPTTEAERNPNLSSTVSVEQILPSPVAQPTSDVPLDSKVEASNNTTEEGAKSQDPEARPPPSSQSSSKRDIRSGAEHLQSHASQNPTLLNSGLSAAPKSSGPTSAFSDARDTVNDNPELASGVVNPGTTKPSSSACSPLLEHSNAMEVEGHQYSPASGFSSNDIPLRSAQEEEEKAPTSITELSGSQIDLPNVVTGSIKVESEIPAALGAVSRGPTSTNSIRDPHSAVSNTCPKSEVSIPCPESSDPLSGPKSAGSVPCPKSMASNLAPQSGASNLAIPQSGMPNLAPTSGTSEEVLKSGATNIAPQSGISEDVSPSVATNISLKSGTSEKVPQSTVSNLASGFGPSELTPSPCEVLPGADSTEASAQLKSGQPEGAPLSSEPIENPELIESSEANKPVETAGSWEIVESTEGADVLEPTEKMEDTLESDAKVPKSGVSNETTALPETTGAPDAEVDVETGEQNSEAAEGGNEELGSEEAPWGESGVRPGTPPRLESEIKESYGVMEDNRKEGEHEGKKKHHHRSRKAVFVSRPRPSTADASANKSVLMNNDGKSVFEAPPRAAVQVHASALREIPAAGQAGEENVRTIFESKPAPSTCDVGCHSPSPLAANKSVYTSEIVTSHADAGAYLDNIDGATSARSTLFQSPGRPSLASARAVDPVPDKSQSRSVFQKEPEISNADARAENAPVDSSKDSNSPRGGNRTLFTNAPRASLASARAADTVQITPSQQKSVFEKKAEPSNVAAKWSSPVPTKQAQLIYESKPAPSTADAAAGRTLKSSSCSESNSSCDSSEESEEEVVVV